MVPGDGHAALGGSSSQDGVSVVVDVGVVIVAPADGDPQLRGVGVLEVVGVVEGGAVSVLLQGGLVALQLVPVAGILNGEEGKRF